MTVQRRNSAKLARETVSCFEVRVLCRAWRSGRWTWRCTWAASGAIKCIFLCMDAPNNANSTPNRLPGVALRLLDVPGHFGFFACQPAWQKQLLGELLAASCVDNPAASGCAGWAAAGEEQPFASWPSCKCALTECQRRIA